MEKGKQLLPEILANPTPEGGAEVLGRMGVDKSFINNAFQKFGSYGSKIGLNNSMLRNAVNKLGTAMDKTSKPQTQMRKPLNFDSAKYPKI